MTLLLPNPTTGPSVAPGLVRYAAPMTASSPYVADARRITIDTSGRPPAWLPDLERRVNQLLALRSDWDSYGAQPVHVDHVVSALRLLVALVDIHSPMPTVVPTAARGVQFEWQSDDFAVEARVGDDGAYIYVEDHVGETDGVATPGLLARAAAALASAPLVA